MSFLISVCVATDPGPVSHQFLFTLSSEWKWVFFSLRIGLRRTGPVAGKGSSPPPRSSSLRIERLKKEEMGERSEVNKKGKQK